MNDEAPKIRSFPVFLYRVAAVHMITYVLAGTLSFAVFSYDKLYATGNLQYYMRPVNSLWVYAGPALQVFRGILFAFILWLFRNNILEGKYGWIRLWLLFAGLAILGTAGAAPGSMEGLIYTRLSLREHFTGLPEVLLQTFLFSWLLFSWYRRPAKWMTILSLVLVLLIFLMSLTAVLFARKT